MKATRRIAPESRCCSMRSKDRRRGPCHGRRSSRSAGYLLLDLHSRVKGVKGLAEEIEVRYPGAIGTADDEIASRAVNMAPVEHYFAGRQGAGESPEGLGDAHRNARLGTARRRERPTLFEISTA